MTTPIQLLTPLGERMPDPAWDPWVEDLGAEWLADRYEDMAVVRRIDEEATALQRQGELGLWPPLLGQEAAQVGSARVLRPDDFAFSSYREHAVAWCRGATPLELLTVWRGTTASGWNPHRIGMATPQVVIGAHVPHAVGYAMGIQRDGSDAAAIAYLGDGALSEGDVSEAMVFAAAYRAPVVFFCQNNQFAISEPVGLQSRVELVERAGGFGIPAARIDGNDLLVVAAATRWALDRARRGQGPTFLEAVTYRMGPHTTADDPSRYRDPGEVTAWSQRDPLDRMRAHLERIGAAGPELEQRAARAADRVAREIREGIAAVPDPEPTALFAHVYAEPHAGVAEQRDAYADYLAGFADEAAS